MSALRSGWLPVCAMLLALQLPAAARADWHFTHIDGFRVVSAVGEPQTRRIARDIGVYQAAIARSLNNNDVNPKVPATILLLTDRLWARHVPVHEGAVGIAYVRPGTIHVVVNADSWISAAPVVFHELTHVVLRQNARGAQMPVWYEEGYADFFSTIRREKDWVNFGMAPRWRWEDLRLLPWMPLELLLNVSRSSPEYQKERQAAVFYAESWLMIHYGIFENPERGKQIERYRQLVSSGYDAARAFAQAFPEDHGKFERELKAYARKTHLKYHSITMPELKSKEPGEIVEIADSIALSELAEWKLETNELTEDDLQLFRELAAAAEPGSLPAMQLAALHARRGEFDLAQSMAEKGCQLPLRNVRVGMLCADVILAVARRGDQELTSERRAELAGDARRYYEAVLQVEPDNVDCLLSTAYANRFAPLDSSHVRAGLERAWQRSVRNAEIANAIAVLYRDTDLNQSKLYFEQAMLLADSREVERSMLTALQNVEAEIARRSK